MKEKIVKLAAKLYEARDAMRSLLGDRYVERCQHWVGMINATRARAIPRKAHHRDGKPFRVGNHIPKSRMNQRPKTLQTFPRTDAEIIRTIITPAEMFVWEQLALGLSRQDIADLPGRVRSVKTIECQAATLLKKLNARGTADLTRLAIHYRVIEVKLCA